MSLDKLKAEDVKTQEHGNALCIWVLFTVLNFFYFIKVNILHYR